MSIWERVGFPDGPRLCPLCGQTYNGTLQATHEMSTGCRARKLRRELESRGMVRMDLRGTAGLVLPEIFAQAGITIERHATALSPSASPEPWMPEWCDTVMAYARAFAGREPGEYARDLRALLEYLAGDARRLEAFYVARGLNTDDDFLHGILLERHGEKVR